MGSLLDQFLDGTIGLFDELLQQDAEMTAQQPKSPSKSKRKPLFKALPRADRRRNLPAAVSVRIIGTIGQ